MWTASDTADLRLRISVESHRRERGQRVYAATLDTISETNRWIEMRECFWEFKQSCIHCIVSRTGERIPRSLSRQSMASIQITKSMPNSWIRILRKKVIWNTYYLSKTTSVHVSGYFLLVWRYRCHDNSNIERDRLLRMLVLVGNRSTVLLHCIIDDQTNQKSSHTPPPHHVIFSIGIWYRGTRFQENVEDIQGALSEWKLPVGY